MGGVDIANQLRANYTTHNRRQKRYWKAMFLWLLDLAVTNAYLLSQPPKAESRAYRRFMDDLSKSLMDMPLEPDVEPSAADVELPPPDVGSSEVEPPDFGPPEFEPLDFEPLGFEPLDVGPLEIESQELPHVEPPNANSLDDAPPGFSRSEPADHDLTELGIPGMHVQEKRAKRAYCVSCQQHKEDWKPYNKDKPIQYGQVSREFGTDVTNIAPTPSDGKDSRGYRIRGSRTQWYCVASIELVVISMLAGKKLK